MGVRGLILAAGRGSRMGDLTKNNPKGFLKINGKTLIQWQLDALNDVGINENAIVTGYKNKLFNYNVKYFHNHNWDKTNSVKSIMAAKDWFENNTIIISYSDIIFDSAVIKSLIKSEGDIVIPYLTNWYEIWSNRFNNPLDDAETFKLNKKGFISEIGRKTNSLKDIDGQYMGILKIEPDGWQSIKNIISSLSNTRVDNLDVTGLLNIMIKSKILVRGLAINNNWFEFDSRSDLDNFTRMGIINNFL